MEDVTGGPHQPFLVFMMNIPPEVPLVADGGSVPSPPYIVFVSVESLNAISHDTHTKRKQHGIISEQTCIPSVGPEDEHASGLGTMSFSRS